jgi:hypothetical protein
MRMCNRVGVVCVGLWGSSSQIYLSGRESENRVLGEVAWNGLP